MSQPAYVRAFSTLGCAESSLPQILDAAARHRIPGVEIRCLDGSLDVPDRLAALRAKGPLPTAPGIRICSFDTSLRLSENTDLDREALLRFVPWAEELGVARLRVFDGPACSEGPGLVRALDTLGWWRSLRARHGWRVDLMVETHSTLTTTPAILDFLARAPADTALLWDSHHTWRIGGEAPADTWRAIASRVVHIHVKDSVATPAARHPYAYVLCGEGEFPMPALLRCLVDDAWDGILSLEWERKWHPQLAPLDQALSAAANLKWW